MRSWFSSLQISWQTALWYVVGVSVQQRVANDEIEKMFIYHFGPLQGGGVVLVPHRGQPNAPYRLLGACFFVSDTGQQYVE